MIRAAICDDEIGEAEKIASLLRDYAASQGLSLSRAVFHSAMDLIDAAQRSPFDLILLDVMMPALSGMDTAKEIRAFDPSAKLIFITSSNDFATESYEVNASYYMLKPVERDRLYQVLGRVLSEMEKLRGETALIKCETGMVRLELRRLCCCEASGKETLYTVSGGAVIKGAGQFSETADALVKHPNFIRPHRSYVVNLDYVAHISPKEMLLKNGTRVPIARTRFGQVKEHYMRYYLKEDEACE